MSWVDGEWYQCTIKCFEYIKSPMKETPGFELVCEHPEHGEVTGTWWLSDTINSKGVPLWQGALERLIKLGCNDTDLRGANWIQHAKDHAIGGTVAVNIEIDKYGAKAKFIGIPKGSAEMPRVADGAPSIFALKSAAKSEPFGGVADDDVPF